MLSISEYYAQTLQHSDSYVSERGRIRVIRCPLASTRPNPPLPKPTKIWPAGPWDLTVQDSGDSAKVFVSNVVSGTVTRLDLAIINGKPVVIGTTQIANGYMVKPNSAAVILGPTGLACDADKDVLYVASTADNAIFAVPNAGIRAAPPQNKTGAIIFKNDHLRGPLALVLAPNGHLITSNGDAVNGDVNKPSEIVEFTKKGKFIGQFNVDAAQGGAFGIAIAALGDDKARRAPVDDNTNYIIVYTLATEE